MSNLRSDGWAERPTSDADGAGRPLRIDTQTIFRELIAEELRRGRLDRARRARVVRYAARMGLNAVETGRLIETCRREAMRSDNPEIRRFALRIVEPPRPLIPTPYRIAAVVLIALIVDVLIVRWIWK